MPIQRIAPLQERLIAEGWDAFVVSTPENRRYLSGFTGSAGLLLIMRDQILLLTDFRYVEQAEREAPDFAISRLTNGFAAQLPTLTGDHELHCIAFESSNISVAQFRDWEKEAPDVQWVPTQEVVEGQRMIKDPDELATIREAVDLTDVAFAHLLELIHPGMTETQAAWELESYMRTHGGEKVAFELIVGSGPNGAQPHATTSERRIRKGEPIVIDIGAVVRGYHSDMTRTICLGQPDERFEEIHAVLLEAQEAAERAIKPGMTGQEADQIARDVITNAGWGAAFGHSLGHGVGLEIHEAPRLGPRSETVLQPGMVVTVEPGIYIPDWGGIRIEDLAVVTETGCEILTRSNKDPIIR